MDAVITATLLNGNGNSISLNVTRIESYKPFTSGDGKTGCEIRMTSGSVHIVAHTFESLNSVFAANQL